MLSALRYSPDMTMTMAGCRAAERRIRDLIPNPKHATKPVKKTSPEPAKASFTQHELWPRPKGNFTPSGQIHRKLGVGTADACNAEATLCFCCI